MPYYLIDYDFNIATVEEFTDVEEANKKRLDLEIRYNKEKAHREVVILDALSLEALKKTHGRYFYTLDEIFDRLFDKLAETALAVDKKESK